MKYGKCLPARLQGCVSAFHRQGREEAERLSRGNAVRIYCPCEKGFINHTYSSMTKLT